MSRRKFPTDQALRRSFSSHFIFVCVLTIAAFIRISVDDETDNNATLFAMILSLGVIMGLSMLNKIIVDLCNDLNERRTFLNYLVPGILITLIVVMLKIPVAIVDVLSFVGAVFVANLLVYSINRNYENQ